MYLEKCDLCGGSTKNAKKLTNRVRENIARDVWQCKNCGFIFINPYLDPDEVKKLYTDSYHQVQVPMGGDTTPAVTEDIFTQAYAFGCLKMSFLQKHMDLNNKKILDVGCSIGTALTYLKVTFNCDVRGIEPCVAYAADVNKRLGEGTVFTGLYEDFDAATWGKFDVIVATDFIEHLVSPTAFLLRAKDWLNPGGKIFLDTPSYSIERDPTWYFQLPHPVAFTDATLKRMLEKCGYVVEVLDVMDLKEPSHRFIYAVGGVS